MDLREQLEQSRINDPIIEILAELIRRVEELEERVHQLTFGSDE